MNTKVKNTFNKILTQSPLLRDFLKRTEQINDLNNALRAYLDQDLAEHCQVANLTKGRLILTTTSPAWNHCLRFIKPDLLSTLRKQPEWCGLSSIESFVQHDYSSLSNINSQQEHRLPKPKKLSTNNSLLLDETANHVSSDKLAQALRKLAKHQK